MKYGIGNVKSVDKSKALFTTTTAPTETSGVYTLALSYLDTTPKVNDFIAYVNNGAITTLYKVTAVDSTNATLTKIGDIGGGGGKQLYQHIITLSHLDTLWVDLTNDSAEPIDTKQKFIDWLVANKYDSQNSGFYINFKLITSASSYPFYRIRYNNSTKKIEGYYYVNSTTGGFWTDIVNAVSYSADQVRPL